MKDVKIFDEIVHNGYGEATEDIKISINDEVYILHNWMDVYFELIPIEQWQSITNAYNIKFRRSQGFKAYQDCIEYIKTFCTL